MCSIKKEDETGCIKKADAIRMAVRESAECVMSDEYTEADSARVGEVIARVIYALQTMPPADAVPVVRCKDCKCWLEWENGTGSCSRFALDWHFTDADDFCSFGERKDNE